MTKLLKVLPSLLAAAVIFACSLVTAVNPTQTNTIPTTVPNTLPAQVFTDTPLPIPTNTAAPQGIPVTSANVSLVVPTGLGSGAQTESVAAVDEQSGAPWEVSPAYLKITLKDYPLQDKFFQPQLMVYPAQDYAGVSAGATISIGRLQAILASPEKALNNDSLPRLPNVNADQVIGAQVKIITFKNGRGLRVLAEYAQNYAIIDNHDLFYHFEGLTSDGKYYIVTTLPVNAAFLSADSNPASTVPTGGIPFPGYDAMDATTFNAYLHKVGGKLDATSADAFTSSLRLLDTLIQSIWIQ